MKKFLALLAITSLASTAIVNTTAFTTRINNKIQENKVENNQQTRQLVSNQGLYNVNLNNLPKMPFNLKQYQPTKINLSKQATRFIKSYSKYAEEGWDFTLGEIGYVKVGTQYVQEVKISATSDSPYLKGYAWLKVDNFLESNELPHEGSKALAEKTLNDLIDYLRMTKPNVSEDIDYILQTRPDGSWTVTISEDSFGILWFLDDEGNKVPSFRFKVTDSTPEPPIDENDKQIDISTINYEDVDVLDDFNLIKTLINNRIDVILPAGKSPVEGIDYQVIGNTTGDYLKIDVIANPNSKVIKGSFSFNVRKKDFNNLVLNNLNARMSDAEIDEAIQQAIANLFKNPSVYPKNRNDYNSLIWTDIISPLPHPGYIKVTSNNSKLFINEKTANFGKVSITGVNALSVSSTWTDRQILEYATKYVNNVFNVFGVQKRTLEVPNQIRYDQYGNVEFDSFSADFSVFIKRNGYGQMVSVVAKDNSKWITGDFRIGIIDNGNDGNGNGSGNGGNGSDNGNNGNNNQQVQKVNLATLYNQNEAILWIQREKSTFQHFIEYYIKPKARNQYILSNPGKNVPADLFLGLNITDSSSQFRKKGLVLFMADSVSPYLKGQFTLDFYPNKQ